MKKNVMELISEEKIYPIVRNKDAQKAIDIAHALIEGGIKVMEITIENPSLYSAITEISKDAIVCWRYYYSTTSRTSTNLWR